MSIKSLVKKFAPAFLLDFYHYLLAMAGAVVFGFPSRKLIVIGVTGTSGKSTTVDFITRIFEENGDSVASISSIRFKIGQKERKNSLKMTMPGRLKLQKFLRRAAGAGCKYAVLEITSEGIRQHRHRFINFDAAVFTNLSKEHIESHDGFENYRTEKLKLFKMAKNTHIVNIDDENAKYFLDIPANKKILFSTNRQNNYSSFPRKAGIVSAEDIQGGSFSVNDTQFRLNLLGDFNVYNALAATAAAQNYGISLEICRRALEKVKGIPGRMEIIQTEPFLVVIDYAHTPVQLESVYQTLSNWTGNSKFQVTNSKQSQSSKIQNSKLICVLGSCGGGRDKWKRPELGKIAENYCKEIIITDEDPYDENPLEIMKQVSSGIKKKQYQIIEDRKEAIKKAISLAKPGDAIIITGKGAEPLMCVANGKKIQWDDREIVREALNKAKS